MKTLIALLFAALVASNVLWYFKVEEVEKVAQERVSYVINELDRFYFGFCLEAREAGVGTNTEDFKRLCGV